MSTGVSPDIGRGRWMAEALVRLQAVLVNLAKEARSPEDYLRLAKAANPGLSPARLGEMLGLTANLPGVRHGSLAALMRSAKKLVEGDHQGP